MKARVWVVLAAAGAAYFLVTLSLTYQYNYLFGEDLTDPIPTRREEQRSKWIKGNKGTEDRSDNKNRGHSFGEKPSKPLAHTSEVPTKSKNNEDPKPLSYEDLNRANPNLGVHQSKGGEDREAAGEGVRGREASTRVATTGHLSIDVTVAKWMLEVTVDDKMVLQEEMVMDDVKFMKRGGLYLVVLNPATAVVMHVSRHRTFERSGDHELLRILEDVQPGRILVLAAMHEGFMQMSDRTVNYLRKLGSRAILDMTMGDRWAWIWAKEGRTWAEGAVFASGEDSLVVQGGPLRLHARPQRTALTDVECAWPRGGHWDARRTFCAQFEGYGDLCSCWSPVLFPVDAHKANSVAERGMRTIPTVIVASERPLLLHRCLLRLMSVPGADPERMLVVADGDLQGGLREVRALVNLYGIKFEGHDAGGNNVTLRITRHYRTVMEVAFRIFSLDPYVILLEEDLYVAADFYSYFAQTAPLLASDPTLYCVSAWNDLARDDSGGDPRLVMRSETMAGLGWLLSRKVYQDVIIKWPGHDKFADWDMWMRLPEVQQGRECLVPEVSRTFHFGAKGAHLTDYFQANFYVHTSFNTLSHVTLANLDKLSPAAYEQHLKELLLSGVHLDGGAVNPCNKTLLPRNSSTVHVLWIKMNEVSDDYTYMGVVSCLRLWNLDLRAHYKLLWRLRWKGTPLLMVGWPASPFSVLKPQGTHILMRYDPKKPEDEAPVYIYQSSNYSSSIVSASAVTVTPYS